MNRLISSLAVALILTPALHAGASPIPPSPDQVPEGLAKSDWQSIRAAYEAGRHAFHAVDGSWKARNPGQRWTTTFDGRGFLADPNQADWQWGLELKSFGFGHTEAPIHGKAVARVDGQRLTYHWNETVQEWFINDQRGLEHGFIVTRRPGAGETSSADGGPLSLTLATRGTLRPGVSADAQTICFRDTTDAPVVHYTGLKCWDADGKILPSRFEAAGENRFRLLVEEAGARYPITIDPIAQQAYLKSGNNGEGANDGFGTSVGVSGDTVVIGAPQEDGGTTGVNGASNESGFDSGAAYVFIRSGTSWSQQAYLKASNTGMSDGFGSSVAISGDTIVVGANAEDSSTTGVNSTPNENAVESGAAYVFTRVGTTWSQQAYLKSGNTGTGDLFGTSVGVSGDTVIVGASSEDSSATGVNGVPNDTAFASGAVYVFIRTGTTWTQQAFLKASNTGANDEFGRAVAVSGDTVVVGAFGENSTTTGVNSTPNDSGFYNGAAYVFIRSGTTWSQQAYLKANNTNSTDMFGLAVAISADTVVIGAMREDSSTTGVNTTPNESLTDSGATYVFTRSGTTWSQQAYLKGSQVSNNDLFGASVAISGDTLVVGAQQEDSSTTGVNTTPNESMQDSGAAYVFTRSGTTWSQQAYLKASNAGTNDRLGNALAIAGDTIIVGASSEDSSTSGVNSTPNDAAADSGAAYVLTRSGTTWSQQAYMKASNTPTSPGNNDAFGVSVAVSGNTVVIGANGEDSDTTGVNGIPNESAPNSGAAYVFTRTGATWSQQAFLKASNTGSSDGFGISVGVSGNTIVVGANNEDSSTSGVNSTPNENETNSGAAYVFTRSGTTWTQEAYLKAGNPGSNDSFGISVSISGNTVVVGSSQEGGGSTGVNGTINDNAFASGAAYVFTRSGTTWSQQAYLKASQVTGNDRFGVAVAVSDDTLVVGANQEDSNTTGVNSTPTESASNSGAAYVFTRSGTTWSQQAYLKASNTGSNDGFGGSVAVSADTVVVGARAEDSTTTGVNGTPNESSFDSGAAYVFSRSGTTWSQQAFLKASNTGSNDDFGRSVAVSGDTVVVGASGEDSNSTGVNSTPNESGGGSGAAYVFTRSGTTWGQQAYLKAGNSGASDEFGCSVAILDDMLIAGALGEASSTSGINSLSNESSAASGAAYIFDGLGPAPFVMSISPSSGNLVGGTVVTLTGTGFTGATGVTFGGVAATNVVVVNSSTITCTTPPGSIGASSVIVTNLIGTNGANSLFTYIEAPDISVAQGGPLTDGTGSVNLILPAGSPAPPLTFTIRNSGSAPLTGLGLTLSGPHAADFNVSSLSGTSLPVGSTTATFTVTFSPSSGGLRTAAIQIASNVTGSKNPFDIALAGRLLSFTEDTDNDGLNDASELRMAALGFDWQVSQPTLVSTLYNSANGANLFTTSQIQTLNLNTPLISRNPTTGRFTLTLGLKKSTDLTTFSDFPFGAPGTTTTVNGAGKLEFEFPSQDNAAFFRLQAP